jgi:hypothetical protein
MALYNQSDGRTEFQFAERRDIDHGDYVHQNGAKDLYRVVAKSERMVESVLVSFIVLVERQRS